MTTESADRVEVPPTNGSDVRTAKSLARSIFKDMKRYGIPNEKILAVASEMIGLVTEDLEEEPGRRD